MLDFADFIAINKFDRAGSLDALRDVRKQVQRAQLKFDKSLESMQVFQPLHLDLMMSTLPIFNLL